MAISYSLANNKITVTGYSALTPADFTDLHTEDKAGTLDLIPATIPAMNMTLTTQIKPADELALKIDFILASSGAGAGDTIDITGTDKDGNAQTETLTTTADGTFTTTKWFKTITDIDCNGFSSGTLTVRQNQWGVVWKQGDNSFRIECFLAIGNSAGDATYFEDTKKNIIFDTTKFITASGQYIIQNYTNSYITLGECTDETNKKTRFGCHIYIENIDAYWYGLFYGNAQLKLYSFSVNTKYKRDFVIAIYSESVDSHIWNSLFKDGILFSVMKSTDIYNLNVVYSTAIVRRPHSTTTIEKVSGSYCSYGIWFQNYGGTIKNIWGRELSYAFQVSSQLTAINNYIINGDFDVWNTNWVSVHADVKVFRQYTFNLKVIDKDGNPITTAKVKADYKTGVCFAQEDADANGNLVTDKTITKGFYNQANGNNLVYQETGFDYEYIDLEVKAVGYATHKEQFSIEGKMSETDTNIVKLNRIGHPPALESHNV